MFFFTGAEVFEDKDFSWLSGLPGFRHIRAAAQYVLFLLFINSYFIYIHIKKWTPLLLLLLFFQSLLLYLLFLSGSRACIILISVFLISTAIYYRSSKYLILNISIFLGGFLVAWLFPFDSHGLGVCRLWSCDLENGLGTNISAVTTGRSELWKQAIDKINSSGLLGMGLGSTLWSEPRYNNLIYHPHNFILQYIQDAGLFFIVVFSAMNFMLLKRLYFFGFEKLPRVVVFSSFGLFLFYILALVDGVFYFPEPILMTVFLGAIITAYTSTQLSGEVNVFICKNLKVKRFLLYVVISIVFSVNTLFCFWHELYQRDYRSHASLWVINQKIPINLESVEPWLKSRAFSMPIDNWVDELSIMQKSSSDPGKFAFYQFCSLAHRDPILLKLWMKDLKWQALSILDWPRINYAYKNIEDFKKVIQAEGNCYTATYSEYFLLKFTPKN